MEWICKSCDKPTEHDIEDIEEENRPELCLSVKLTCCTCKTVDFVPDEIFDSHVCHGSGDWCFCNDTKHQHCVECDGVCAIDATYEP